jgi:broad specificity phosphatase PhoE
MDLIIVRHGQSTGNISTDDVPDGELTPLGRRQAAEAAARLADDGLTHVLASPLIRALATGSAIAEAAGIEQVEVWPELQEHRSTVHRGFGKADLLRDFPRAHFTSGVETDGWDHGGETYETATERGFTAIAKLRERFSPGDRVVVATHGAFANYLLRAILHLSPSLPIWFSMNNCGITRVRFAKPPIKAGFAFERADADILVVNDTSHISEVS